MHLNLLPRLAAAAIVLATLATPAARATTRLSNPIPALSAPPSYPDSAHVLNGCLLSTLRFVDRFETEYPGERAQTLVVRMRNADGSLQAHTIALLSWRGQAWGRDEYYGVFSLGCAAEVHPDLDRLSALAERKLEKHAQLLVRNGEAEARSATPAQLSSAENLRDVTTAARLIPYATTIYWVRCGSRELPMIFFRPTGRRIAVYDPAHGTSTADCAATDDAKIVLLVASRLGYRAESVRAGLPQPELLASADVTNANAR